MPRSTVALLIAWVALGALLVAQASPADGVWAGAYSATQASRGEAVYQASCANCHSPDLGGGAGPALAGAPFMETWDAQPLLRLFRTIRDTMPRNNPGSLTNQAAADIVAYVLQSNGFPAGEEELRPDDAVLTALALVPEGAARVPEVRDFSMVSTVGCLEGSGREWTLSDASAPVTTDAAPATAGELVAAASLGGDEVFRLVSVLPFEPAAAGDRRVHIKGLIHRTSDGTLLNVTALQALDASCGG